MERNEYAREVMAHYRMREVRRYYLRCPKEARRDGRDHGRERTTRRRAAEDFIEALGIYLTRQDVTDVARWAIWAAQVIPGNMTAGPAPDGTTWGIVTKLDYL